MVRGRSVPNRLFNETSPYLLQHAANPVDWYPWCDDAFAKAKAEDKPVLLSVGYAACHWCHVMAHESFEDAEVADILNRLFVAVKVDREERPDIDQIYQQAIQLMGQQGGWPLTVFLTPQGAPFFGGTYFPPNERHGRPSFRRVLLALAEAYRRERSSVMQNAEQLREGLARLSDEGRRNIDGEGEGEGNTVPVVRDDLVPRAAARILGRWDSVHGGLEGRPKFPNAKCTEVLLRAFRHTQDKELWEAVTHQLDRMAAGGIYDHLGGGFHRYSTDERWLVPHFEKMLYDQAQLVKLYTEGWQLSGRDLYAQIVSDSIGYLLREMRSEKGAFYSAQDADSEGVEGKFFVWTPAQVEAVVGHETAAIFCRCYDVTERGNFETSGTSVLQRVDQPQNEHEGRLLAEAREKLLSARGLRVRPATDDKVLTSWNGLMIGALAEAGRVFRQDHWVKAACHAAESFLLEVASETRLFRTRRNGLAKIPAFLDDYAFLADGLIAISEATLDPRWLVQAKRLCDGALDLFYEQASGVFYLSPRDGETLIARPTSTVDHAIPSGLAIMLQNLVRLGLVFGEKRYVEVAERTVRRVAVQALQNPFAFPSLICAIDLWQESPIEIVLRGDGAALSEMAAAISGVYLPNRVVVGLPAGQPVLEGLALTVPPEPPAAHALAVVCRRNTCSAPVSDGRALKALVV